jgi:PAS domain S-box-containing protein
MPRASQKDSLNVLDCLNALLENQYAEIDPSSLPEEERPIAEALNQLYHKQRREDRLQRIVESTPVGICITDENGFYEYVNPQYCRLYRYDRDELIGKHFTIVVPPSDRDKLSKLHDDFVAGAGEVRGEWRVLRKDGEERAVLADAALVTDLDGQAKKVTFIIDITQRRQAEESLREVNEQLQQEIEERLRVERTQREVERIIRHDLRNPLNGVFTASELLRRTELSDEQKDLIRIIRESGQRLKSMIDSSLDLAKMELGIFTLEAQTVEIQETLLAVQSQLLGLMAERNVTVTMRVDEEALETSPPSVMTGEAQYLENLFANLVRNAIEASPEGAEVTVHVTDEGETFLFDIHNYGIVPEEIRDRFFERNASYGKQDGNGLGTFVASLITSAHSGSMWFTTSESEGTHLFVRLPKSPPVRSSAATDKQ